MTKTQLKVLFVSLFAAVFSSLFASHVSAAEPAYPSCPAGTTKLAQFGPSDQIAQLGVPEVYSLVGREAYPTRINFTSSVTSGSIVVYQGEGHHWNFGCNEGNNNDPDNNPGCDQTEPNEIARFYMNGTKVGEFTDHNPDDDRTFTYNFPLTNMVVGSNQLTYKGIINTTRETAVFVKGVVCTGSSPTNTPMPTATPTKTPTLTPTKTPTLTPTPTSVTVTITPTPTQNPTSTPPPSVTLSPTPTPCPTKNNGDANCDGLVTLVDFEFWRRGYHNPSTPQADFNGDGLVNLVDHEVWRSHAFTEQVLNVTPTTADPKPTSTP